MNTTRMTMLATSVLIASSLLLRAANSGSQVTLFNGRNCDGWRAPTGDWQAAKSVKPSATEPKKFAIEPGQGMLVNGASGKTSNLVSAFEHGDVEAHLEFCVPTNSNSGIYFMGRYEIQVFDSWGVKEPKYSDCGGIYQRWKDGTGYEGHPPRVNASKPPGEWQSFDVVFRAPRFDATGKKIQNATFIKVIHNGQVVHENVEVTGPTRSATFEKEPEKAKGPLMLQGDHGPVAYRNLTLKPVVPQ